MDGYLKLSPVGNQYDVNWTTAKGGLYPYYPIDRGVDIDKAASLNPFFHNVEGVNFEPGQGRLTSRNKAACMASWQAQENPTVETYTSNENIIFVNLIIK